MTDRPSEAEAGALARAGAVLTIDLGAIVANWRALGARHARGRTAAVVKADAYGLGAAAVAPALAHAGCDTFFVAQLDEAIALRRLLADPTIAVLAAPVAGLEREYLAHRLLPVLNQPGDIEAWAAHGAGAPAILHVDTGMARLGLSPREVERLADDPGPLARVRLAWVMSHLACADEPGHPLNAAQLDAFRETRQRLGLERVPASFANSSGIFLGPAYHFDLLRPGVALYGANPVPGAPNPMRPVVRLEARILQLREVDRPVTVGYGATRTVSPPAKLATVAIGYADGYLRSLSNRGHAAVGGRLVPVVGRVSMDLIVLDVSACPDPAARPGAPVELIGPLRPLEAVAAEADTIPYEILTSLGPRYARRYLGGDA